MKKKTLTFPATTLAAVIALAGCSASPGGSNAPGMDHSTGHETPQAGSAPGSAADHNGADTMFVQGMIPHHAQAVEMSAVMLQKQGLDAKVADLANRITAAQGPEIDKMTAWLRDWNEPTRMPGGHAMTGMMGEGDLKELDAAQGTAAARLFLTQMVAHHEGAVEMAEAQVRSGANPEAVRLARDIVTSQQAEISEMKDLLAAL